MAKRVSEAAVKALFDNAHTAQYYKNLPVDRAVLKDVYNTFKFGPTAFNCTPMRVMYVTSEENKKRLIPLLDEGNRAKSLTAPVTAVLAYDTEFPKYLERLAPFAVKYIENNQHLIEPNAVNNSWLQGGYFITAARAHGLDCGPMAGFDGKKIDEEFFDDRKWKSFMVVNLGYADESKNFPRAPRLDYEEAVIEV